MADHDSITVLLTMPQSEADAFARFLKRTTYDDCYKRANRIRNYPDGRNEVDVMWSAVAMVENQFAERGFAPR